MACAAVSGNGISRRLRARSQLTQEKLDFSAEKGTPTFPALWFGALPIPQHTAAYKAAPCTLGLTKLASK